MFIDIYFNIIKISRKKFLWLLQEKYQNNVCVSNLYSSLLPLLSDSLLFLPACRRRLLAWGGRRPAVGVFSGTLAPPPPATNCAYAGLNSSNKARSPSPRHEYRKSSMSRLQIPTCSSPPDPRDTWVPPKDRIPGLSIYSRWYVTYINKMLYNCLNAIIIYQLFRYIWNISINICVHITCTISYTYSISLFSNYFLRVFFYVLLALSYYL